MRTKHKKTVDAQMEVYSVGKAIESQASAHKIIIIIIVNTILKVQFNHVKWRAHPFMLGARRKCDEKHHFTMPKIVLCIQPDE